ncbi:hypothetical protein CHLNCDRAFT_141448 [Chlorella variabilis]|uniref:RmlD-like substrate binding domain-containing protein n=1 Tax=Chlorella variabilis TaxID=554065 RepID=E1ZSW4_CHLVA|nr:hypothetical protein CHLNCDRAFT_141448 [Chlorella variabilis]EFN51077.1 hypothetical protein CHLNCDRAFT_141448 [Chlorella variabilis]|eukprot:XP_005843179.1 hypothetical protein CHLNCDRAFT_141448 [Chlorella variabilis]
MAAILITGGTGYFGQFCVEFFAASGCQVGYTHWSSGPQRHCGKVLPFKVNLAKGEGLEACLQGLTRGGALRLVAVINAAAISQPAACERDEAAAAAVNVPTHLLAALAWHRQQHGAEPLLIHMSTDQVYDGSKARWREGDPPRPVNAYGRTKLAAERAVAAGWPNHAILRSSIIFGPEPPVPVGRPLFLQFIDGALAAGKPTTFFNDEWRSPIRVRDILRVCQTLINRQDELQHRLFNMGGPDRLSRADMAAAVAAACGYDPALILAAPAASVPRPAPSPADISMDSSRLEAAMTPFEAAIRHILGEHQHPDDRHHFPGQHEHPHPPASRHR